MRLIDADISCESLIQMAKDICHQRCENCNPTKECNALKYAERAYNAGYRKQTEVAREIFAEIKKFIQSYCNDDNYTIEDMSFEVAELENKYTKEGAQG